MAAIRLDVDYPDIPVSYADFVEGSLGITAVNSTTGNANWAWIGTKKGGTATGFYHFQLVDGQLYLNMHENPWNPNGTFEGDAPFNIETTDGLVSTWRGRWELMTQAEKHDFDEQVAAKVMEMGLDMAY